MLSGQSVAGVNGSALPRPANCANDGDGASPCTIVAGGTLRAGNPNTLSAWEIRYGTTAGGLAGAAKTCRNAAALDFWDLQSAPGETGLDGYDNIDDYKGAFASSTLVPTEGPWGNAFLCGGIRSGGPASGTTNPEGTFADLTPGTRNDGTIITGFAAAGCDHNEKQCVWRDLASGLLVAEMGGNSSNWSTAIARCSTLGTASHPSIKVPVPVQGIPGGVADWRLPTQKEVMQLAINGLARTLRECMVDEVRGYSTNPLWTATSSGRSSSGFPPTSHAWTVRLGDLATTNTPKSHNTTFFCVR